jgi:hypothetical protein
MKKDCEKSFKNFIDRPKMTGIFFCLFSKKIVMPNLANK